MSAFDQAVAEQFLVPLWEQADADGSNDLSLAELRNTMMMLDIDEALFTNHNGSLSTFFTDLDDNPTDGAISLEEIVDAVTDYSDVFLAALMNGAGSVPDMEDLTIPPSISAAQASVSFDVLISGGPDSLFPGTRKSLRQYFADTCGVSYEQVIMTYVFVNSAAGRRLQGAETMITATVFVADDEAAATAQTAVPSTAADLGAVPAFSSLTISSVAVSATFKPSIDTGAPVTFFVIIVLAYITISLFAQFAAKKVASGEGEQGGCCATGWCSYFAVKPWALGELIALAFLAFSLFQLLAPAQTLIGAILSMVDLIIEILTSTNGLVTSMLGDVTSSIPTDVIGQIQEQRSNLELLPFIFVLPGVLPAVFTFLAGCCPLLPMRKGKFCMTKCMIFFVTILCLEGVVFYAILSAVVQLYADFDQLVAQVPSLADADPRPAIASITGTCGTIGPMITQMVADNQGAMDKAAAAGMSAGAEAETLLTDLAQLSGWLNTGCDAINDTLSAIPGLYGPATFCLISLLFVVFTSETLCCAAGCCCSARKGPKKEAKKEVEMMQNV